MDRNEMSRHHVHDIRIETYLFGRNNNTLTASYRVAGNSQTAGQEAYGATSPAGDGNGPRPIPAAVRRMSRGPRFAADWERKARWDRWEDRAIRFSRPRPDWSRSRRRPGRGS